MDPKELPGPVKVAILLHAVGGPVAQQMLDRMEREEREIVRSHMAQLRGLPPSLVETVAKEFTEVFSASSGSGQVPARIGDSPGPAGDEGLGSLKTLRSLNAEKLLELVQGEHPQTIALILLHVGSEVAGEVLGRLDDEVKVDVSMRIAKLDRVISGMIDEIDRVFEEVLKNKESAVVEKADGIDRLAEILNLTDETSSELILGHIEEKDPALAARIQQKMFVFEDLLLVDDRGMQKVLRKVETKELAVALKGASEDVRRKIYRNMSSRAAEMLQEEIEAVGAVRMKEVEDAQHGITRVIQELEKKGELVVSGRRGGDIIP